MLRINEIYCNYNTYDNKITMYSFLIEPNAHCICKSLPETWQLRKSFLVWCQPEIQAQLNRRERLTFFMILFKLAFVCVIHEVTVVSRSNIMYVWRLLFIVLKVLQIAGSSAYVSSDKC